ncbi:kinase-like protein [Coniochaeta ligniaria NRRL 30616]|uniref:Kinase-like protein n=1 Tax=Coniochaeta ligniaria NRRL 30616 TaxID=1408157 RepID=A0A1J7J6A0_9PEZI|nr:kinase-like protein [Coniochaeta ligniaria NRRL 30616]
MIAPVAPALATVRGFQARPQTPVTSGDEDSDCCPTPRNGGKNSTKRGRAAYMINDVVSANCSPTLKPHSSPAVSGIAKLRMQLEPLSLSRDSTAPSTRSSSMTRSESRPGYPSPLSSDGHAAKRGTRSPDTTRTSSTKICGSTSGDETASENGSTSYEISLETDFVSESVGDRTFVGGSGMYADSVEGGLARPRHKMTADDFEPLRCLGKGTYGTVLLVKQRATGRLYAQKQFKKASLIVHKKLVEQTKTERQILESVNRHPFVVKLFYAFQDREKLYLILEYGQGGELFTHLSTEKMFAEDTAAFYMAEMALALSHLHDTLGVVYRDLKPENCLLDSEGHLLLTDFGLSKVAVDETESCNSMLGTVEYMAPEVILGKKYGKAVDWWSFGALGFDLMTGSPPFRGGNHAKIQDNIVKQKLVMPYFLSADAKDLLTRLLRKEPSKRLGSNMPKDLALMKKHRFFRKIDWKRLAARELEPPIQPLITDPELAENFAPEFTELSLSPVVSRFDDPWGAASVKDGKDDIFGGFSYVASSSLLEGNGFMIATGN